MLASRQNRPKLVDIRERPLQFNPYADFFDSAEEVGGIVPITPIDAHDIAIRRHFTHLQNSFSRNLSLFLQRNVCLPPQASSRFVIESLHFPKLLLVSGFAVSLGELYRAEGYRKVTEMGEEEILLNFFCREEGVSDSFGLK
jgi:hypothetical protein